MSLPGTARMLHTWRYTRAMTRRPVDHSMIGVQGRRNHTRIFPDLKPGLHVSSDSLTSIEIAVPLPVRQTYSYLPADGAIPLPGMRVRVPVGSREVTGWVVPPTNGPLPDPARLRPICRVLDDAPVLDTSLMNLARWAWRYYHHPPGEVLAAMLPAALKSDQPLAELEARYGDTLCTWQTEAEAGVRLSAARQALRQLLMHAGRAVRREDIEAQGISPAVLRGAIQAGVVSVTQSSPWSVPHDALAPFPHSLTPAQARIAESILAAPDSAHLLEGVTGSGKTEIYLWLAHQAVSRGTQALILVPEIGLTPQFAARFEAVFGKRVALYHSGMTDRGRLLTWLRARYGHADVLIGTRSALFLPMPRPGLIVIDEEHDTSFKQQEGFRYHARDLAVVRAHQLKIPVVLGSATPSLESLMNAERGRYIHHRLTERAQTTPMPGVRVLDVRTRPLQAGLSQPLIQTLQQTLDQGQQALVFINRRGYAPVLSCDNCQWIAECRHCDVRLTLHRQPRQLACHHCDQRYSVPETCPACGQATLAPIGSGTERTEDVLESLFPDFPVVRIDRDSARQGRDLPRLLKRVHAGEPCLLVGTQMVAKGHDFPNLALVAILNADGGLFSADFRGTEWMAQQLIQVAGRAGRRASQGQVILQTRFPEHPVIQALARHDYASIAREELERRRLHRLPPYVQLVALWGEGRTQAETEAGMMTLRQTLAQLGATHNGPLLTGPFPAVIARKRQRYRAVLWIQDDNRARLRHFLAHWLDAHPRGAPKLPPTFQWRLDVDALETL